MQIIGLNMGGALSRLAPQQEASQENRFDLLNRNKVLAKLVIWALYGPLACLLCIPYDEPKILPCIQCGPSVCLSPSLTRYRLGGSSKRYAGRARASGNFQLEKRKTDSVAIFKSVT